MLKASFIERNGTIKVFLLASQVPETEQPVREPVMIARAKNKVTRYDLENVALMLGNGECLPFKDDSFDLAYLVTVLGEIPDKDRALQELYRVLRPGGVLSISEYLLDPDYPLRRTTIAWARQAGFEPFQEYGNFFAYVVNFRRGYAEV